MICVIFAYLVPYHFFRLVTCGVFIKGCSYIVTLLLPSPFILSVSESNLSVQRITQEVVL